METQNAPVQQQQQPIPASFQPGPKVGKDGAVFYKHPTRELYDQQWREAVARGEDPRQGLVNRVESTPTSSFIEYWWRKAKGKPKTRAQEKLQEERRENERVEEGSAGLLDSQETQSTEAEPAGGENRERRKSKLHDKLRWGL